MRVFTERAQNLHFLSSLSGAALGLLGTAHLLVGAGRQGDPWKIAGVAGYGASLVTLYVCSTLYHSRWEGARGLLRKLDHNAIYLLIAGSYTPFTLVTLRGAWGWSLLGLVWGLALVGIVQELLPRLRWRIPPLGLYLGMGWLIVIAIRPLGLALPSPGLPWLVAGGLSYTVGVAFYALDDRWEYAHFVWHLFVLGGSASHFLAIRICVL